VRSVVAPSIVTRPCHFAPRFAGALDDQAIAGAEFQDAMARATAMTMMFIVTCTVTCIVTIRVTWSAVGPVAAAARRSGSRGYPPKKIGINS